MWTALVPQDQHHHTSPSMMHLTWNTAPFSPNEYFLGPSMTSPFWTSPTQVNPFNLLENLLPPFILHHRRSLPLKTYKRPLFLSICGIKYLLSPRIWRKVPPPEQKHVISFHQHLDEVASMTYQAYQTCALSSSFILRTLNWTFDLPTRHKLTVQQSPSPTNLVVQQKEPFYYASLYCLSHDTWLKMIKVLPSTTFKMRINLW